MPGTPDEQLRAARHKRHTMMQWIKWSVEGRKKYRQSTAAVRRFRLRADWVHQALRSIRPVSCAEGSATNERNWRATQITLGSLEPSPPSTLKPLALAGPVGVGVGVVQKRWNCGITDLSQTRSQLRRSKIQWAAIRCGRLSVGLYVCQQNNTYLTTIPLHLVSGDGDVSGARQAVPKTALRTKCRITYKITVKTTPRATVTVRHMEDGDGSKDVYSYVPRD
ncbi:hypothetical protein AYL99_09750 [Fonsecaea erecta]|uniref:Uncharacterized protein n=1 Tax=Fonsecaea erecta TaxID=1367422 RepID=A0A178Z751_9EURO|nr:hypothetical protein AYL99_09750 [Fonsecaea erecta]OAP55599.1 hypothetical protein AYL99_09750 [Fonsecaea erecta]